MEQEVVLREAHSRRDAALAEARRLDDFIRMYNDLRGRPTLVGGTDAAADGPGEFMLEKSRPAAR